ncbi:MAG TPA: hypothetical protein VLA49_20450 [Anaerolineales bacterium]|nr:hypothetical protein [Anaerolineales bacterium]
MPFALSGGPVDVEQQLHLAFEILQDVVQHVQGDGLLEAGRDKDGFNFGDV